MPLCFARLQRFSTGTRERFRDNLDFEEKIAFDK
jgi:hypothetical protein